jgi:phospholipase C
MSLCGYRKLQADRARTRWLIGITYKVTQWADDGIKQSGNVVGKAAYTVAKYAALLFATVVNIFWLLGAQLLWVICRMTAHDKEKPERIKHVFVLMLENRSFDHMLGFSNLQGVDAITGQPTTIEGVDPARDWNLDPQGNKVPVFTPAKWAMDYDPGHEFTDVKIQLCGVNGNYPNIDNSGFVADFAKVNPANPGEIMQCYSPDQLPVITTLAREFAVCDHWFSSMPGPTWPNRFFIHAASSGGLDHSPTTENVTTSILFNGYKFDNGTIYDRLDDEGLNWTVYRGDLFPQALAISGMIVRAAEGCFQDFDDFSKHVNDPNYNTAYAFIEPDYHISSDFVCGNSQHPKDDVTRGEALIKQVYETIRNSPHWESSLLIITYDEHGGFYDHVPPPPTVAPGDTPTDPENNLFSFDFKQLGVRVPAIVVSPLIPRGTIDHTVYDHTSALATVENIFGLLPLTNRDKVAHSLNHLFSLATPRTDAPSTLPEPAHSGIPCPGETEESIAAKQMAANPARAAAPPDPSMQAFLHVAFLRDLHLSPPQEKEQLMQKYLSIDSRDDARQYLGQVQQKFEAKQGQHGAQPKPDAGTS